VDMQRDTSPPSAPLQRLHSGFRSKPGTPISNPRKILLCRDVRDESSARNSVLCQSLATLRRYGTR
jgi:hypothetical protein